VIQSAARWLAGGKPGLLLTGGVGTGKTTLLRALSLLVSRYSGGYQSLHERDATIACNLARSTEWADNHAFEQLKTYHYLGLDDLGTEPVLVKSWGNELSPIVDLIHARYDALLVTVISTNLTLDEIGERYGPRVHDRVIEQYDRVVFTGKSFRKP
jgi:DNA replication protein DnaC